MSEIIGGFHYDLGGREVYEDRVRVETLVTQAGIELCIAAVADGVGGRDRGERAAQIALDTLFEVLQRSITEDVPTLLARAVNEANRAIYAEGRRNPDKFKDASTTLAVAAIANRSRLHIANVGDSRVYFCRRGRLTLLSMDHTFGNLMPLKGVMSREAAAADQRAGVIMRALGPQAQVQVDLGLYVNTTDPSVAHTQGRQGIPLEPGDAVLVCSDGLTKEMRGGTVPFVTDEEISRVLMGQEGEKAARSLVSFALGRDADDNVSAAVLQVPDPEREAGLEEVQQDTRRRQLLLSGGIIAAVVLIAAAAVAFIFRSGQETSSRATAEALALAGDQTRVFQTATAEVAAITAEAVFVETAIAETLTAIPPTATPTPTVTPTPFLTPVAGQVAVAFFGEERLIVREREVVGAQELPLQLQINHTGDPAFQDASLYGFPGTQVQIGFVNDNRAQVVLFRGGEAFVETGDFPRGVELPLNPDTRLSLFVFGSCLGIDYVAAGTDLGLSCFEGTCGYFLEAEQVILPERQQLTLDLAALVASTPAPIPLDTVRRFDRLLREDIGGDGVADADTCLLPLLPTATPTPTATRIIIPTRTRTPVPTPTPSLTASPTEISSSSGGGGGSRATATRTRTPIPTPTATPKPPTATPRPPTATPKPPTVTPSPEPPTDTPKPPTATPKTPTATPKPPTATPSPEPPTATPKPPTATPTPCTPQPTCQSQPDGAQPVGTARVTLILAAGLLLGMVLVPGRRRG